MFSSLRRFDTSRCCAKGVSKAAPGQAGSEGDGGRGSKGPGSWQGLGWGHSADVPPGEAEFGQ